MNLPVFERLGVLDKVRALSASSKPGGRFRGRDNERGYNTYGLRGARHPANSPCARPFQVWRQDFDKMLLRSRRCVKSGADARGGAMEVLSVEQIGPAREHGSKFAPMRARSFTAIQGAPIWVDAQRGATRFLSAKKKQTCAAKNNKHQRRRTFSGHFRGAAACARGEGRRPTSASYRFDHGWMWMIPPARRRDEHWCPCVGRKYLKQRKGRTAEFPAGHAQPKPGLAGSE